MSEWIAPVTDRADGTARMTYADMNRITGDAAYLENEITGSVTLSKTMWTRNDIISKTFWTELLTLITNLASMVGAQIGTMTGAMLFDNINTVESALLAIYNSRGNTGVTDFMVYDGSVVTSNEAYLTDSTFLDATAQSTWNAILGN